jgi:hypothetical protein
VIANDVFDAVGGLHIMKGDLGGNLHAAPPVVVDLKRQRSGPVMVAPGICGLEPQWTFFRIANPSFAKSATNIDKIAAFPRR